MTILTKKRANTVQGVCIVRGQFVMATCDVNSSIATATADKIKKLLRTRRSEEEAALMRGTHGVGYNIEWFGQVWTKNERVHTNMKMNNSR
jgi:hypothetical protein